MKNKIKRPRKLMRERNRNRINRLRNQQTIVLPVMMPIFVVVLIKLNLEAVAVPLKMVERLQLHISKLSGNTNFPTTVPGIPILQALATELSDTITAIDAGDKGKIPHRDTLMLTAENLIRQLSYDIQNQSAGDAEKIQSAGFEVRKGRGSSQKVGDVLKLRSKPFKGGKVKLLWAKIPFSRMNFIEMTDDPVNGHWVPIGKTTKSSFEVEGLTPGKLSYYRVYGSNTLGDGTASGPVEQRAL